MSNKTTYKQKAIVDHYRQENELQLPEKSILQMLEKHLPKMKMLDIGVGGGRTTLHFANLAKEYLGVDYSEEMVTACKMRFPDAPENISFQVCDATNMKALNDNSYDFVLFSFNGIDSISHEDRDKAFREIKRIGKPGGYFCFSTHNLNSAEQLFNFKLQINGPTYKKFKKTLKWAMLNFIYNNYREIRTLNQSQFAILNDGVHLFKIKNYYIRPLEQIRKLEEFFSDTQVYSLSTGEIIANNDLEKNKDPWLYYICRFTKD